MSMPEPTDEEVNARIKEIQEKMKGVKYVMIKVKYNIKTGETTVQHSPKKRIDGELVLACLLTAYQWLFVDFVKRGLVKPPEIKAQEARGEYIA